MSRIRAADNAAITLPIDASLSDWTAVYPNDARQLDKIHRALIEERLVWWGRSSFNDPAFRNQPPKMHLFASRTHHVEDEELDYWTFTYSSPCGYSFKVHETLYRRPRMVLKAPAKSARCSKCEQWLTDAQSAAQDRE